MQSTQTLKDADPHDIFLIEPEIVRALRASKSSSDLAHDAKTVPSAPQPEVAPSVAPDIAPGMALPGSNRRFVRQRSTTSKSPTNESNSRAIVRQ